MTKIIFRKFKDGEVIALFPEEIANNVGYYCLSYLHFGQHGAASPDIVSNTTIASEAEYQSLFTELTSIGYEDLQVVRKFTYAMQKTRMEVGKGVIE